MGNVTDDLSLFVRNGYGYDASSQWAWESAGCPWCQAPTLLVVARAGSIRWFRCPACMHGSVIDRGRFFPTSIPLADPEGVPEPALSAWHEVRACLGAGSYTAAVMMCRKLLVHMAVVFGLPEKNDKDRSPTFAAAVDHLEAEHVISRHMLGWVDQIRDTGNEANHELAAIEQGPAMLVAEFTQMLLDVAFAGPAKLKRYGPPAD